MVSPPEQVIEFSSSEDFAIKFSLLLEEVNKDPINNFIKNPLFCNFNPTPGQLVVLKILFGQELLKEEVLDIREPVFSEDGSSISFEHRLVSEQELYTLMTGRSYDKKSASIRKDTLVLILGRRSGKTALSSYLMLYYAIHKNWRPMLRKTPVATCLINTQDKESSKELLDKITSTLESSPILKHLVDKTKKNTSTTRSLAIPFVIRGVAEKKPKIQISRVQISVVAANASASRGKAVVAFICDEIAHWGKSDSFKTSDEAVINAIRPALVQFHGSSVQLILSSPSTKQGVLYKHYDQWCRGKSSSSQVVFKAPTWLINKPEIVSDEALCKEFVEMGPEFNTEYGANFVDAKSNFFAFEMIEGAVMRDVGQLPPESKDTAVVYAAAIDAAFEKDTFTFSIMGNCNGRVRQYVLCGWRPEPGNPVSATAVSREIALTCQEFGITALYTDQHSFIPLKELFSAEGITLEKKAFSAEYKKQIYYNFRKLANDRRLDLLDSPELMKELRELNIEIKGGGLVKIYHPRSGSDDYADSTVVSAFECIAGPINHVQTTTFDTYVGEFPFDPAKGLSVDGLVRFFQLYGNSEEGLSTAIKQLNERYGFGYDTTGVLGEAYGADE